MKLNGFLIAKPWTMVYGPDGDPPVVPPPVVTPPPPPNTEPEDDKPTISQKKMNEILKKEREKANKDKEAQIKDLETLRNSKNLTEQEKDKLAARIEELQSSMLTKEELAAKERKKIQEEAAEKEKKLSTERDEWKSKFESTSVKRAILDGAVKAEAFSPSQIVELLQSKTRLAPIKDDKGEETGEFVAHVRLQDVGGDGKPIILEMTVDEALKRMKDRPEDFGNLFKSGVVGGLGGTGGTGTGGSPANPAKMSHEEYLKWRQKNGLGAKKSRT